MNQDNSFVPCAEHQPKAASGGLPTGSAIRQRFHDGLSHGPAPEVGHPAARVPRRRAGNHTDRDSGQVHVPVQLELDQELAGAGLCRRFM